MTSKRSTRRKFGPFTWENSCGSVSGGGSSRSVREKSSSHDSDVAARTWLPRRRGGSHHVLSVPVRQAGPRFADRTACRNQSRRKGVLRRSLSRVELGGLSPVPKDRGAEQGDVDGPSIAALLWEWWRLKHEGACLPSRRQAAFRGLMSMTPQNHSARKQNTQSRCRKLPTSSQVVLDNSPEPTTRGTRCKKMEAWRINGTWMMVTSCVTRSWCRLTCMNSTTPMNEPR